MSEGDSAPPKEEKSLMHKLASLKRRSVQSLVAKLGIAEETHDDVYNEYFERFSSYEKDLEKLRQNLQQLHDMNRQLLVLKQATAQQLCHIVPVGEELHKVSKAIGEIGDGTLESFDTNVSEQYKTHVLGCIAKELQYCAQLHVLHARRDRKRKDYDSFRREVHDMEQKQPPHKDLPAAKERLERSERECVGDDAAAAWAMMLPLRKTVTLCACTTR